MQQNTRLFHLDTLHFRAHFTSAPWGLPKVRYATKGYLLQTPGFQTHFSLKHPTILENIQRPRQHEKTLHCQRTLPWSFCSRTTIYPIIAVSRFISLYKLCLDHLTKPHLDFQNHNPQSCGANVHPVKRLAISIT